ncbi:MAG TPA: hypothetical protein VI365_16760 [Trebonia sp.]
MGFMDKLRNRFTIQPGRYQGRDVGTFPQDAAADRKPSRAERRAAARTAQAEANLTRTEQQIHQLADEVRHDLKDPA